MRKREYKDTVTCDGCGEEISKTHHIDKIARAGNADLCLKCLKKAYLEYKRIVDGEVPDRRGGFRQLGVYDG